MGSQICTRNSDNLRRPPESWWLSQSLVAFSTTIESWHEPALGRALAMIANRDTRALNQLAYPSRLLPPHDATYATTPQC